MDAEVVSGSCEGIASLVTLPAELLVYIMSLLRGVRHDSESRRQLQESLWNLRILPESFESCLESLESHEISRRIIILIPSKTL